MGLEPTTFCMASRRSSQLSYIRGYGHFTGRREGVQPGGCAAVQRELAALADPERAAFTAPYLDVVPGGYGEGDVLLGIPVPAQRRVARRARDLPLDEVATLLASPVHEHRFVGLVVLVERHRRADAAERAELSRFYLDHRAGVDNWDLVDASARELVGEQLVDGPRGARRAGRVGAPLGPADRGRLHPRADPAGRARRDVRPGRAADGRPAPPDPQGDRLDAARGRQARRGRAGRVPRGPPPADAPDDAALRDRAAAAGAARGAHGAAPEPGRPTVAPGRGRRCRC